MLVVGRARLRPLAGWRRDQTLGESTDNPAPPGPEPVDDAKSNSRLWMTLAEHLFDARGDTPYLHKEDTPAVNRKFTRR